MSSISYLSASTSASLDADLMSDGVGYSIDQLMELAGLSVAQAIQATFPITSRVLFVCGPGNNGGDGLVAARHLHQFGFEVIHVVYPKLEQLQQQTESLNLYHRLYRLLYHHNIPIIKTLEEAIELNNNKSQISLSSELSTCYDVVVDSMFGFGFKGDVREPFSTIIRIINESKLKVVSIDVASGWDVNKGPMKGKMCIANPHVLVSLTAPKQSVRDQTVIDFSNTPDDPRPKCLHFLGGRFVPDSLIKKYNLNLPQFPGSPVLFSFFSRMPSGSDQIIRLN